MYPVIIKDNIMDCESCANYYFDEDYDDYICGVAMDEDDVYRITADKHAACPYYRNGDEYLVVRSQM